MEENTSGYNFWKNNEDTNSGKNIGCFFCVLIVVALIWICISAMFQIAWPDWFGFLCGYVVFGGIAVSCIASSISEMKSIAVSKKYQSENIVGKIVGHIESRKNRFNKPRYFPVYEFYVDGVMYNLKSNIASGKSSNPIGKEVNILHNITLGKVYCKEVVKSSARLFVIFSIASMLFVALLIVAHLKYNNII